LLPLPKLQEPSHALRTQVQQARAPGFEVQNGLLWAAGRQITWYLNEGASAQEASKVHHLAGTQDQQIPSF